jgi:hypothetical protein
MHGGITREKMTENCTAYAAQVSFIFSPCDNSYQQTKQKSSLSFKGIVSKLKCGKIKITTKKKKTLQILLIKK